MNRVMFDTHYVISKCSLGMALVAQSELGICAILLADTSTQLVNLLQKHFAKTQRLFEAKATTPMMNQAFLMLKKPWAKITFPLDVGGTPFQKRVWSQLAKIPASQTTSYSNIAMRLLCPKGQRAVAQACAANLLAVAIPCHRVVRQNGALSGYRFGPARKQELLNREINHV